jgi:hypothetical protein
MAMPAWVEESFVHSFAITVCLAREGQIKQEEAADFYIDLSINTMKTYNISESEVKAILTRARFNERVHRLIAEEGGCKAIVEDVIQRKKPE